MEVCVCNLLRFWLCLLAHKCYYNYLYFYLLQPGVRTSPLAKDGLVKYLDPNILTVYQGFKNGVSLKGKSLSFFANCVYPFRFVNAYVVDTPFLL